MTLCLSAAWALDTIELAVDEPRAFGYTVGDVVSRGITVRVPKSGCALDEASLPRPARRGTALELRRVALASGCRTGADRYELRLDYQVFLAPREVRTLEMPPLDAALRGPAARAGGCASKPGRWRSRRSAPSSLAAATAWANCGPTARRR